MTTFQTDSLHTTSAPTTAPRHEAVSETTGVSGSEETVETGTAEPAEDKEEIRQEGSQENSRSGESRATTESTSSGEGEEADSVGYVEAIPVEEVQTETKVELPPAWLDGLEPIERPGHTGHDQGVVSVIVLLMLGLCLSFKNIQRLWGSLIKRLWDTRLKQSYDDITSTEKRTILLMLTVTVIFISLIGTAGLSEALPSEFVYTLGTVLRVALLVGGYFIFQYLIYWVLGYVFSTDDGRRMCLEGFMASMSLLGLTLLLPGLCVLFYPDLTEAAVWLSIVLYIIARMMFISKGFRIFYTNLGSVVYFILYLCSLEVVPITILYYLAL